MGGAERLHPSLRIRFPEAGQRAEQDHQCEGLQPLLAVRTYRFLRHCDLRPGERGIADSDAAAVDQSQHGCTDLQLKLTTPPK